MVPDPGFQVFGHPQACNCRKSHCYSTSLIILSNLGASWVHLGAPRDHLFASSGSSCNQDALEKLWNIEKHRFSLCCSFIFWVCVRRLFGLLVATLGSPGAAFCTQLSSFVVLPCIALRLLPALLRQSWNMKKTLREQTRKTNTHKNFENKGSQGLDPCFLSMFSCLRNGHNMPRPGAKGAPGNMHRREHT